MSEPFRAYHSTPRRQVAFWTQLIRAAVLGIGLCMLAGCSALGGCGLRECPADAKVSVEVRALLAQSPALGTPNLITVQTVRGVVYLRGLVSTPYQISTAGSVARRAAGVTGVQNLLAVDNSR